MLIVSFQYAMDRFSHDVIGLHMGCDMFKWSPVHIINAAGHNLNIHVAAKSSCVCGPMSSNTVKVLINARAIIRIVTFHGEGDGPLFEARVLTNNT